MRALRYHGPYDLRLEHDVPAPTCQPHQVTIRPSYCGICGSDLHAYTSPAAIPFQHEPHPLTGETWPVTLGHEFTGEVVEVGKEVQQQLKVGDPVVVQPTICCGKCEACVQGATNCCDSFGFVGLMGWGGGLSDLVAVDARFVFRLPEKVSLKTGALVEPLAVAWHAVRQTDCVPGKTALVLGAGPIGLATIQCLKVRGAEQIIVAEVSAERRKFASNFGATTVIDPSEEDPVSVSKQLCNGQGPDYAFDCAGVAASIKTACKAVKFNGHIVNLAVWDRDVPFHFNNLVFGEKKITAALSYTTADFVSIIKALEDGSIQAEDMITRVITMDKIVEDGFTALTKDKDHHVKILVDVRVQ